MLRACCAAPLLARLAPQHAPAFLRGHSSPPWRRSQTVVATPARVDPLHRTVTWYVRFEGEWAERASKAAVNKRDWYEISLARGVELSDRQKEDLAFRYFAERMRRSVRAPGAGLAGSARRHTGSCRPSQVVKAVVKDAGAQAVMGAEELERRVNKQLKRQWEALPPDMRVRCLRERVHGPCACAAVASWAVHIRSEPSVGTRSRPEHFCPRPCRRGSTRHWRKRTRPASDSPWPRRARCPRRGS